MAQIYGLKISKIGQPDVSPYIFVFECGKLIQFTYSGSKRNGSLRKKIKIKCDYFKPVIDYFSQLYDSKDWGKYVKFESSSTCLRCDASITLIRNGYELDLYPIAIKA